MPLENVREHFLVERLRFEEHLNAEPVLDPASVAGAQVVRTTMPAVWDWPLDAPVKLVAKDAAGKPLELVPYGCTKLRVSMFPVD